MSKRAAIIITDKESVEVYWAPYWASAKVIYTSGQLLADLRLISTVDLTDDDELAKAKALVRVHLPKEGEES